MEIVDGVEGPSEVVVEQNGGVVGRVGRDESEGRRNRSSSLTGEEKLALERSSSCDASNRVKISIESMKRKEKRKKKE